MLTKKQSKQEYNRGYETWNLFIWWCYLRGSGDKSESLFKEGRKGRKGKLTLEQHGMIN